jgi:hypothetical protein
MQTKTTASSSRSAANKKIDALFAQATISLADVEDFSRTERQCLEQKATKLLTQLKDTARDNFLAKIDPILAQSTKNKVWEHNHVRIRNAIAGLMRRNGTMPPQNVIAEETGLSRQTIAKHFAAYKSHPDYLAEVERFKFMSNNILANVFKFASNGDMRAARLYFEMVGALQKQPANTVVNEQNNYIQINNTILSQENLKQLSPEQLNQIEQIVTQKEYQLV